MNTSRTNKPQNASAASKGTLVYPRQHKHGLTLPQQNAIDLLAGGKNDTETAELLSLSRTCITKWRLYDPVFQAALNRRRDEVWSAGADRMRGLIVRAIEVVAETLDGPPGEARTKVALNVLKMASPPPASPGGLTDPEDIVLKIVQKRRTTMPDPLSQMFEQHSLPPLEQQMQETWEELDALAHAPDDAGAGAG